MRCTFACRSKHRSTVLYVGTRTVPDAVRLRCCTCQVRATKTTQASPAAGRSTQGCGTCKLQLNRPAQWRFQPSGILVRAETLISCCTLCTTSIVRPSIYLNHQIKAPLYLLGYFFFHPLDCRQKVKTLNRNAAEQKDSYTWGRTAAVCNFCQDPSTHVCMSKARGTRGAEMSLLK